MATDTRFLGFGLVAPFRRDRKLDFTSAGGAELVRSSVGQILSTKGATEFSEGELSWRTEFGSALHLLRHQNNDDVLQELARINVVDALINFEPRLRVTDVQVTRETQDGENILAIRVRFDVIDQNVPSNDVLLEGLESTFTV